MWTDAPARNKIIGELITSYCNDFGNDAADCLISNLYKYPRLRQAIDDLNNFAGEKMNVNIKKQF